ncbi:MAG: hypothetical protein ACI854_002946 [Arenicella sp.]|jgi:hypothetical protein
MQTKPVKPTSTIGSQVVSELPQVNNSPEPHKLSKGTSQKRLVLGCGALVYELVELIKHNPLVDQVVDLHCLPATLHNTPQLIAGEVDKFLSERAGDYAEVLIAYGDCGTAGALDKVLAKHQATRLPGAHCYEFFAGSQQYNEIIEAELGSFFLTDFLVKFFDRLVIEGLGIDRYPELKDVYFKHYKQMVYIAQTEDPKLQLKAQQCAQKLGLEYHYRYVGFTGLMPVADLHMQPNAFSHIEVTHV